MKKFLIVTSSIDKNLLNESILKKISYISSLFVIVSCARLNNDIKPTPFAGKVLINQKLQKL